jgi:hypothetical protein
MKPVQARAARLPRCTGGGRRLVSLALAAVILAVAAPPSAAAPKTSAEGLVSILSPRAGARARDQLTTVRLRLGVHADPATLQVELNGRDVTGRFQSTGGRGRQRVGLFRHHDLVPGRNRLVVSVKARNGRRHDTDVVRFVSDLHRLGSALNPAERAPQALVTRVWQPATGEYAIDVADPTAAAAGLRSFVGTRGQQFQVLVLDAASLAVVSDDSFSYLGPAWTRPGPAPADPLRGLLTTPAPGASASPVQACRQGVGCTVVVQSLSAFGTPDCAIPGPCGVPTRPGDSLATIGGTAALNAIGVTAGTGQVGYSLVTRIFLDGTFPGAAGGHERVGCYDCTQNSVVVPNRNGAGDLASRSVGRISGVLVADQLNDLGFWPYDFTGGGDGNPPAPGTGDLPYTIGVGTTQDPVRVGSQSFTADPAVTTGFLVVSSDGGTAPTWAARTFAATDLTGLYNYLLSLSPDAPLVIRTIGKPAMNPNDKMTYHVWLLLLQWNSTSELFSLLTGSDDLVLVHAVGAAAATGLPADQVPTSVEASSLLYRSQRDTAPPGPTRLTGVLRRDNRGVWRSAVQTPVYGATPAGQPPVAVNTALSETANDPRVDPFPAFSGNQLNAYAWVGSWILNGKKYDPTIDVRAAYSQLSSAVMLSASADTITMPDPMPTGVSFTAADLGAVAAQVQLELLYASRAVKVIEDLTTMMSAYGPQAGNDLAAAVDQVKGNFTTVTLPTNPLVADLKLIFSAAIQVASVLAATPGDDDFSKGDAIGLAGDVYDLISGLIANGGGAKRTVTHGDQALVVAATLAADLGNALWDGDAALTTLRGLITSDWGKTRTLGKAIGPNPANTGWDVLGQQEWFTASMRRSVKTEAYRLLLPVAYDNNRVLVRASETPVQNGAPADPIPGVSIDNYYYRTGFTDDRITPFTHAFKPDGQGGWIDIPPGAYHTKYMVQRELPPQNDTLYWPCQWLYSLSTMVVEHDSVGQRIYYSKTYPGPFVNDLFAPWQTLEDTDHLGVWQPGFYVNRLPFKPIDPNHEPWPDQLQCSGL